jgi:hypothetical protein
MKNVTVSRASGARARLPDNLCDAKKRLERDLVLRLHAEGVLFKVHQFIAQRLNDFGAEIDGNGKFWLADSAVTDNALWCLLRRDVESQEFPIPSHVLKRIVEISFAYIRVRAPEHLAQGERVQIVCLKE